MDSASASSSSACYQCLLSPKRTFFLTPASLYNEEEEVVVVEEANDAKRARTEQRVRFTRHIERRYAPYEASTITTAATTTTTSSMEEEEALDENRSAPTTPKVEARREAATVLRDAMLMSTMGYDEVPTFATTEAAVREQMCRIVEAKLEALQSLLDRQNQQKNAQPRDATADDEPIMLMDPGDLFYARVPRSTRIPGLWGAKDMWAVTPLSLATLGRLRSALMLQTPACVAQADNGSAH
jgi:hypothetical protein